MPEIVIVNASSVLTDAEVQAVIPALQRWDDEMLRPAWGFDPCTYSFASRHQMPAPNDPRWPIYVNRHSTDPGALGWHDDRAGRIFGRVFAGDCLRYGISWTVDLSHEAAEMRGDPTIDRVVTLADGRQALVELCDPVEDDRFAIDVGGVKLSDFVLPGYFGMLLGHPMGTTDPPMPPFDYGGHLSGPCPTLTTGGYQTLIVDGQYTQVTAMYLGGDPSYRSQRYHRSHRAPRIALP